MINYIAIKVLNLFGYGDSYWWAYKRRLRIGDRVILMGGQNGEYGYYRGVILHQSTTSNKGKEICVKTNYEITLTKHTLSKMIVL